MNESEIFAIERPHPKLFTLYLIYSIFTGFLGFPLLFFRYRTLRYEFDEEGIHMSWGFLFRKEINLTYARIQDVHLTRGILQRWLNLANIQIQTASGNAGAEMKIEGLLEFQEVREFLYSKMRGLNKNESKAPKPESLELNNEVVEILTGIKDDLQSANQSLKTLAERKSDHA